MEHRLVWLASMMAVASAACLPTSQGDLGNGGFTYVCSGSGFDTACGNSFFSAARVPSPIALDTHFELDYSGKQPQTQGIPTSLRSVSTAPVILEPDGKGFRFTRLGTVAVLARDPSGIVGDFIHVVGAPVDHLDLSGPMGDVKTGIQLSLKSFGQQLDALPMSQDGSVLAGGLSYAWSSSDPGVASVSSSSQANQRFLTPVGPGTATISVSCEGKHADVVVTVGGAP